MKFVCLVFFLAQVGFTLEAQNQQQYIIFGNITNKEDGEPLPFASVFVQNTTFGTAADTLGNFQLMVPNPNITLVCSFVGFKVWSSTMDLRVGENQIDISLEAEENVLNDVEVRGDRDTEWTKQLEKFKDWFIGKNARSKKCEITNPWVLEFSTNEEQELLAKASAPLRIMNNALGYQVEFTLTEFEASPLKYKISGYSHFTIMDSNTKQQKKWEHNRLKTFKGSQQHFFSALENRTLKSDGFEVYAMKSEVVALEKNFYTIPSNQIKELSQEDITIIDNQIQFNTNKDYDILEIHYKGSQAKLKIYGDVTNSVNRLENFKGTITLTQFGIPSDTLGLVVNGDWSISRVSDLLPLNYHPVAYQTKFNPANISEKIDIHLSKEFFYPYDTVWFKAYMSYARPEFIDSMSKVLHVDLISIDKKIIKSQKLLIMDGVAIGSFALETSELGAYYLRCYTNLNINTNTANAFIATFPVIALDRILSSDDMLTKIAPTGLDIDLELSKIESESLSEDSVKFTIKIHDEYGYPVEADLSVAIFRSGKTIKENLENKNGSKDKLRIGSLGVVELHPVERGLTITGVIRDENNFPISGSWILLDSRSTIVRPFKTKKKGKFAISNLLFFGKEKFNVFAVEKDSRNKPKHKAKKIDVFHPNNIVELPSDLPIIEFEELKIPIEPGALARYNSIDSARADSIKTRMLLNVDIKSKKIDPEETFRIKNGVFYGEPNFVVKGDDLIKQTGTSDVLEALTGMVPGLYINRFPNMDASHENQYTVHVRGGAFSITHRKPPMIFVDGIPFANPNDLAAVVTVSQIDRVEVITSAKSLFGTIGANGVIAIYTKKSTINAPVNTDKNVVSFEFVGLDTSTPYNYNYRRKPFEVWIPFISTNDLGENSFKYSFPSEEPETYVITIFGVAEDGSIIREAKSFTMKD